MLAAALLPAACNQASQHPNPDSGGDAPPPPGKTCEQEPDPHCGHPIDRVLVPRFRAAGIVPRDADRAELCRRMAIDLVGRIPTAAEQAACAGQTPAQMADAFMSQPGYLRTQRRAWAERLAFDGYLMWWGNAVEMDDLARRLYREEIRYDDFVGQIAVHPGFYARHQGDDWSAWVVSTFLGRTARRDELDGLRPLTRPWMPRQFCDGAVYYNLKQLGVSDAEAMTLCTLNLEWGLQPCACQAGFGSPGCRSTTLGRTVDFGMEGCTGDYRDTLRVTRMTFPGNRPTTCPDGKPGCHDRDLLGKPLVPLPAIDDARRKRLGGLGEALAERTDFWEAAADRELKHLLGWWQSSFRRPDTDVPEVRAALAEELRRTGSVRAVQKLIVTSLLYAAPAEPPPGAAEPAPPPWSMGPTKLLAAESWLDSAGVAVGEVMGACDFRFINGFGLAYIFSDSALVERVPSTLGRTFSQAVYDATARALGGCDSDHPRPTVSSLGLTMAQHEVAQLVCGLGSGVLPTGFKQSDTSDGALDGVVRHLYRRVLSREATDAEVAEMRTDMRACLAAGKSACAGPEEATRWLCQRLIDSAEFGLY